MDRKQAHAIIGKIVMIDEGQEGSYIGVLNEVVSPPRKTWRGKVQIQAVVELPAFKGEESGLQLQPLKYAENEIIECSGTKLTLATDQPTLSFKESLAEAVQRRWSVLQQQLDKTLLQQKTLEAFLTDFGLDFPLSDNVEPLNDSGRIREEKGFISYTFHKENGQYFLADEQNEKLELKDCPLEFQWYNEESFTGFYEENGTFISKDGIRYSPKDGATFTIDKKQFDPYFILQNELEPSALESLEKGLETHGLTHENIVDCHNALLGQLLRANGKKTFQGVNFLTFRGHQGLIMVQHHFDRKLHDDAEDDIYDRFEFTTEQGKRAIVTYTNEFSR